MAVTMIMAWIMALPSADALPKGEWTAVACEIGEEAPAEVQAYAERIRKSIKDEKAWVRFEEGKFTLALGDRAKEMSGKYDFDGSRKPERITLVTHWREHP